MSPKQKKSTEKGPRHKRKLHKQSPEHKESTQTVPRHKKYTNNPTHANKLAQTVSRTGGSMQKLPKHNKSTEMAQTHGPDKEGVYTSRVQTNKEFTQRAQSTRNLHK